MVQVGIRSKVKSLDELSEIIGSLKQDGRSIVQCHGVFDLLHPGHIKHFEAAKREGDILVVTLTQDRYVGKGPGRPVFNEHLRAESIAALECVDFVAINEWPTAVETIGKLKPHVYCKGKDYSDSGQDLTGKIVEEDAAVRSVGGRIHFTDELTFSSTKLINLHFDVFPKETQSFLEEFRSRYSAEDIIERLRGLKSMKVLVIGDTIIDEYAYCSPMGKSPKENLIPARYLYEETFAGGILAIANHLAGFCGSVHVVTCLGRRNSYEQFIRQNLAPNVEAKFLYHANAPTIVKRRFVEVDLLRKLFEVCLMDGTVMPEAVSDEACRYIDDVAGHYDLVVVGDYGHGLMGGKIVDTVCRRSRFLAANAQTNSANFGFNLITKYQKADYFCIDEPELRLASHDNITDVDVLLDRVAKQLDCHQAVVTRGHRGAMVYDDCCHILSIPVFSREVVDRVGAGDAFFAVTSPCAAAGFPLDLIGFIGNAAGALKIRIVGNRSPIEPVALFRYIGTLLK